VQLVKYNCVQNLEISTNCATEALLAALEDLRSAET
jgi:hypothetical protein